MVVNLLRNPPKGKSQEAKQEADIFSHIQEAVSKILIYLKTTKNGAKFRENCTFDQIENYEK